MTRDIYDLAVSGGLSESEGRVALTEITKLRALNAELVAALQLAWNGISPMQRTLPEGLSIARALAKAKEQGI